MSDNTFRIVLRRSAQVHWRSPVRSTRQDAVARHDHEVIANVDAISAPELVYPEAVYLHNGETYFVRELDLVGKVAYVERHEMDYYTQAVLESNVCMGKSKAAAAGRRPCRGAAGATATSTSPGRPWPSRKSNSARAKTSATARSTFPPRRCQPRPCGSRPTTTLRRRMKAAGHRTSEGVVGLRNLAIVALPIVAMCDSRDLGGVVDSKNLGRIDDDSLRSLSRAAWATAKRAFSSSSRCWPSAGKWSAIAPATTAAPAASACRTCGRRSTAIPT